PDPRWWPSARSDGDMRQRRAVRARRGSTGAAEFVLLLSTRTGNDTSAVRSPENGPSQMVGEERLRKTFDRVAARRVPRAAAFVGVRPDNRMIGRHASARVGSFVERGEHCDA